MSSASMSPHVMQLTSFSRVSRSVSRICWCGVGVVQVKKEGVFKQSKAGCRCQAVSGKLYVMLACLQTMQATIRQLLNRMPCSKMALVLASYIRLAATMLDACTHYFVYINCMQQSPVQSHALCLEFERHVCYRHILTSSRCPLIP